MDLEMDVQAALEKANEPAVPSPALANVMGMKNERFHAWRPSGRTSEIKASAPGRPEAHWSVNDCLSVGLTYRISSTLRLIPSERMRLFHALTDSLLQGGQVRQGRASQPVRFNEERRTNDEQVLTGAG